MTSVPSYRLRVSTDDIPPGERFAGWTDGVVRRRLDMEFIDTPAGGPRLALEVLSLGGLTASLIRATPSRLVRRGDDDRLTLAIGRVGRHDVVLTGSRCGLPSGGAALFDHRRRGELIWLGEGEAWLLALPRDALRPLLPDDDALTERVIPAGDPALRLLIGYLDALFGLDDLHEPGLVGLHVADLVASLLGGRRRSVGPEAGDQRADLRQAALDIIARAAPDPGLDPTAVAARLGVSVRYLHRLLQDTGRTFSEHLGAARLDRALRLLRDPRLARRRISDIALEAGFSDLSHFNRSFRRRFGQTPSAARLALTRPADG